MIGVADGGEEPGPALRVSPNPASQRVGLEWAAGGIGRIEVTVFDLAGRRIRRLASESGDALVWDLADGQGRRVPRGIYFLRARRGEGEVRASAKILVR